MSDKMAADSARLLLINSKLPTAAPATGPGDPTSEEVADYIADMLQELRDLAKSSGLGSLSILLELAEREAKRDGDAAPSSRRAGN